MRPPSRISYELFKQVLAIKTRSYYRGFLEATKSPRTVQSETLLRILRRNTQTEYGKAHQFLSITSTEDYQHRVPVATFEHLQPYINRQRRDGSAALTQADPIYFNRTSGTTGTPKDVPVTPTTLLEIKQTSQLNAYILAYQSNALRYKVFAIGGPVVEDETERGIPIGSASGLLYRRQSSFVSSKYILPPEVFSIENMELRYLTWAILGVRERFVSAIVAANPSTFLRLCSLINSQREVIVKSIVDRKLPVTAAGLPIPRTHRDRLSELKSLFDTSASLTFTQIWPELQGAIVWGGGSCGFALEKLSTLLPSKCRYIELGYLSSEFRGTINIDLSENVCIPPLHHTFFEFVEQDDWENKVQNFLLLHELELGKRYYIFATTASGLYRYDINDIVRISGFVHETPALEFVQKGRGTTNITGEKVTEYQVLLCMQHLQEKYGLRPEFFIALADELATQYILYIESKPTTDAALLATAFDTKLQELNVEYLSKRKSQRLAPTIVRWLPLGTKDEFHKKCVADGQRDSQFKYPHLLYLHQFNPNLLG